jgi:hypothetical protein
MLGAYQMNLKELYYNTKRQLRNMIFWAIAGRNIDDYSADFSLQLINIQLKRFDAYITKHGHLVWHTNPEDETYKGFKELLDLSNKVLLTEHPKIEALYDAHTAKWGELKITFTPIEGSNNLSSYSSRYANAKTEEENKQAHTKLVEIHKKEHEYKRLLLETFCDKMKKIENYWD